MKKNEEKMFSNPGAINKILEGSAQLTNEELSYVLKKLLISEKTPVIIEEDLKAKELANKILTSKEGISDDDFYQILEKELVLEKYINIYLDRKMRRWNCYCSYHGPIAIMDSYSSMARKRMEHLKNFIGPHSIRSWSETP